MQGSVVGSALYGSVRCGRWQCTQRAVVTCSVPADTTAHTTHDLLRTIDSPSASPRRPWHRQARTAYRSLPTTCHSPLTTHYALLTMSVPAETTAYH
eukprot:scaffold27713_cov49-Phaeocystis_antarctica.AAC.2